MARTQKLSYAHPEIATDLPKVLVRSPPSRGGQSRFFVHPLKLEVLVDIT
jgi:hypothetical protein